MMKCWLEEWLDFLFPEPVEACTAPCTTLSEKGPGCSAKRSTYVDIDGEPVEHDWYCPLPETPEMYLRPGLIPIACEACGGEGWVEDKQGVSRPCPHQPQFDEAVAEAERVVRSRR